MFLWRGLNKTVTRVKAMPLPPSARNQAQFLNFNYKLIKQKYGTFCTGGLNANFAASHEISNIGRL